MSSLWNSFGFQLSSLIGSILSIDPVAGGPQSKSCWGQDAFSYQVGLTWNDTSDTDKTLIIGSQFWWNFDWLELTGTRSSGRTRRWTRWRLGRDQTPSSWRTCHASGKQTHDVGANTWTFCETYIFGFIDILHIILRLRQKKHSYSYSPVMAKTLFLCAGFSKYRFHPHLPQNPTKFITRLL